MLRLRSRPAVDGQSLVKIIGPYEALEIDNPYFVRDQLGHPVMVRSPDSWWYTMDGDDTQWASIEIYALR